MRITPWTATQTGLLAVAVASACTTNPYTGERQLSRTAIGAGLGGAAGAGIGALASRDRAKGGSPNPRKGAPVARPAAIGQTAAKAAGA